jgi:hypothetical protein
MRMEPGRTRSTMHSFVHRLVDKKKEERKENTWDAFVQFY